MPFQFVKEPVEVRRPCQILAHGKAVKEYPRHTEGWCSHWQKMLLLKDAAIESFWGVLKKNELVHHRRYKTWQEAIRQITTCIEIFYNRHRLQKRLGYLFPAAYEK